MTGPKIFTPEYYARMRQNERDGWWNAGMRDIAERLLRGRLAPTGTVLDVGCGSGQTMRWFLEGRPGWRALGVDVAREGLRAARTSRQAVAASSALSLALAAESVDVVLTLDVLQHLPLHGGDVIALREMHRVLRPGGTLLLRTNALAFPHTPDDPAYDFHRYRPGELREKLTAAGFAVRTLGRVNAVLGMAEIPRQLRAVRHHGAGYHGILEGRKQNTVVAALCRRWLSVEGRLLQTGRGWPVGRAIVGVCRKPGPAEVA